MKRAGRIIFRVWFALSLVLCLAAVVLWARNNVVADRVEWTPQRPGPQVVGTILKFASSSGGMDFEVHTLRVDAPIDPVTRRGRWEHDRAVPGFDWQRVPPWCNRAHFWCVFWLRDRGVRGDRHLSERKLFVAAPYCAIIALSLVVPAVRLGSRLWAARHHPPGHCRQCGYDLRATPDHCPECGTGSATAMGAQTRRRDAPLRRW